MFSKTKTDFASIMYPYKALLWYNKTVFSDIENDFPSKSFSSNLRFVTLFFNTLNLVHFLVPANISR